MAPDTIRSMQPSPPPTPIDDVVETLHGTEVHDPYRWLEDGDAPAVREWDAAQRAYARSVLDALPGRERIRERLRQGLDCGALGASVPRGRWRFTVRREPGMEQIALRVREGDGPERTLIDPGPMSADGTVALDWWHPSRDGGLVCFGLSEGGDENSTLRLLRTADGAWLDDEIPNCRHASVAFEPEGGAFLYTRYPTRGTVPPGEENYHRHVWRHVIGTDPAGDVRVFGEGLDRTDVPGLLSFSRDGRWSVITVSKGWERTAVYLRERDGAFRLVFDGERNNVYARFVGDRLIADTDVDAPNGRLVEIDPQRPEPGAWRDLVAESEHVLQGASFTTWGIVAHHLVDAASRLSIRDPDGGGSRAVDLPPHCTVAGVGAHHASDECYVSAQSFTWPTRVFRLDAGGAMREVDRLQPPPGFDAGAHPVRQVWYESADGTRVPMFLVGRESGRGATVLSGYGGFYVSRTPAWMPQLLPLLESGGLFALANLRGGGEFGRAWYEAGRRERKQNVFDDFVAAAEWLVDAGLTAPSQLAIQGASNGGLLVGAVLTQRPDLFACAGCFVPLLDMVRYERFRIARLWTREYGGATDPEQFRWLYAYSPYHRVRDGVRYPPVLLTAGEEDTRVDPMHARKMAARLQAATPGGQALLLVEPRTGHGQGKPVSKSLDEATDAWSFLLAHISGD